MRTTWICSVVAALGVMAAACAPPTAAPKADIAPAAPPSIPATEAVKLDVPYVPTPMPVVDQMLAFAAPRTGEYLIDLGSGDGRIVNEAVKRTRGLSGLGVDIDPQRNREANDAAQKAGIADRASFRQEDLFTTDFSKANILTMYLLPRVNMQLRPKILQTMQPGARVVSHAFDMGDWQAERFAEVDGARVFLWIVPANAAGDWSIPGGTLTIEQTFQTFTGKGRDGQGAFTIEGGRLTGRDAVFAIARGANRTSARATFNGDAMTGAFAGTRTRKGEIALPDQPPPEAEQK